MSSAKIQSDKDYCNKYKKANKEHYKVNVDPVWINKQIHCKCGETYIFRHRHKHMNKSKIHQTYLNSLDENN